MQLEQAISLSVLRVFNLFTNGPTKQNKRKFLEDGVGNKGEKLLLLTRTSWIQYMQSICREQQKSASRLRRS